MGGTSLDAESVARVLLWMSMALMLAMTAVVVVERAAFALLLARRLHLENRYGPLVPARSRETTRRSGCSSLPRSHSSSTSRRRSADVRLVPPGSWGSSSGRSSRALAILYGVAVAAQLEAVRAGVPEAQDLSKDEMTVAETVSV